MSGYEYSLRRLFRPPTDRLPLPDQLQFYRQRDLVPSHLYRLGTGILGGSPQRRRVIDASLYLPHGGTPHAQLVRRTLDERVKPVGGLNQSLAPKEGLSTGVRTQSRSLSEWLPSPRQFTEEEYREWVTSRRRLRVDLESLGASEQWLLYKERTPLESSLLSRLRRGRGRGTGVGPGKADQKEEVVEETTSTPPTPEPQHRQDSKGSRGRQRRLILREVTLLQQFLLRHRKRLVSLLMATDKTRDRLLTPEELTAIVHKLRAPMSLDALEVVVSALQAASGLGGRRAGKIDYRVLLNGNLVELVTEYVEKMEKVVSESKGRKAPNRGMVTGTENSGDQKEEEEEEEEGGVALAASLQRHKAPSSMGGEVGRLADEYRAEALRQFSSLLAHCKASGVVLNWELAEKALLMPTDHTRKECVAALRQPGLELLSSHFADPPEPEDEITKPRSLREEFGGAYKELRGRGKSRLRRLSTGVARVKTKTDCWLTFDEFQTLTKHITSRPGFKYKYHGLPDNNAFWPGALLDKLRLWLPSETLLDKPTSLYNVFQPVRHPKVYNPHSPMVDQRRSWPENESGYVQFGSQTRKRYHL